MIGTKFISPLEYKVVTDKETYSQGDTVQGEFFIKNHGSSLLSVTGLKVNLCEGIFKKINQKEDKGFLAIESFQIGEVVTLNPSEQKNFKWKFTLKENYPITDNQQSLYITYGNNENPYDCGQLQLTVDMAPVIKFFLEIFVNFHRFQIKQTKFSKGMIELKLSPPKSREMSNVESLVFRIIKEKDDLRINYNFSVKQLESVSTTEAKVQSKKKEFNQVLSKKDYEEFGSFGHDKIKNQIRQILDQVIPKFFF